MIAFLLKGETKPVTMEYLFMKGIRQKLLIKKDSNWNISPETKDYDFLKMYYSFKDIMGLYFERSTHACEDRVILKELESPLFPQEFFDKLFKKHKKLGTDLIFVEYLKSFHILF
jgi:hypothetical protein